MNIVFYVLIIMSAIYVIFHLSDFFSWWIDIMWIVPNAIWKLIKSLFGK